MSMFCSSLLAFPRLPSSVVRSSRVFLPSHVSRVSTSKQQGFLSRSLTAAPVLTMSVLMSTKTSIRPLPPNLSCAQRPLLPMHHPPHNHYPSNTATEPVSPPLLQTYPLSSPRSIQPASRSCWVSCNHPLSPQALTPRSLPPPP